MIYLDNAATTLKKPKQVLDAVLTAMQTVAGGVYLQFHRGAEYCAEGDSESGGSCDYLRAGTQFRAASVV